MNLNLDLSAVTRFLRAAFGDLREKRLWPIAAVLLVALVAVPVLLSKSSTPAPAPQAALPTPPPSGSSIPALSVQSTPSHTRIAGKARNPFATGSTSTTAIATAAGAAATSVSTAASSVAGNVASALGGTGTSGTSSTTPGGSSSGAGSTSTVTSSPSTSSGGASGTNPPSITPNAKPKAAPSGLTSTQAYDVALAITNSAGGIDTTDPQERLSAIPSDQQPLLVELGVLKGGNRVLFAVEPGAVVNGPGTCIPGPLDCEILSLGQDQTEKLSAQTGSLDASEVALFAVTGISATSYPSAGAADKARRAVSSTGRALLANSSTASLSLFQYEPSLGSIVDLRNLKVGGDS